MPSYLSPGVYIEEVASGSASLSAGATAIPAFVGFTAKAPTDDPSDPDGVKPRLVANWTQFVDLFGGFTNDALLPLSVYGWFNNGGGVCYVTRIANSTPAAESGTAALPAADRALGSPIEISTVEPNANISVDITPEPSSSDDDDAAPTFTLTVAEGGDDVESFGGLTLTPSDRNVETIVNAESAKVKVATVGDVSDIDVALAAMQAGSYSIEPATPDPITVKGGAFTGSEVDRTGINGLVIADDVTMVIVPDLATAARDSATGDIDLGMWKAVQTALISHCEGQANRMAILDAPPGMNVQQIKDWRSDVAMYSSAFAAMYYPWIKVENPAATNGDSEIMVPPSGHIAGIWARTDDTRGVWKAPANEIVRGALDVETPITKGEQGLLNPIGINCIRPFGTRGIRVWGARTLDDPSGDWRYINVRRLFNMIETSIMEGTQFVVFEPNDQKLWAGVTRTVSGFLRGLWRDGALFGATADQAFFVKCDSETNPPESIDEGKLVVEVGIAPVKPAEFVIFRISQKKESSA